MAKNNALNTGRYRGLIISIVVFLLLVASFLALTIYSTQQLARYEALLNVVDKISVDEQVVVKHLFDLQNSQGEDINSPHYRTVTQGLKESSADISQNLDAILNAGVAIDFSGANEQMPHINDSQTLALAGESKAEWEQLKPKIDDFLAISNDITEDATSELAIAVEQAKTSSVPMTESFQNLNQHIRGIVSDLTKRIEIAQLLAIAVMVVYLVFFIFIALRRLRIADAEAIEARRETEEIMETVNTGLFLLDKDLNIGNQYSRALQNIIGTDRIAGEKFDSILRGRISDKDLETTRQFIGQLYNPRVKTKLVNDLNPLNKVNLHSESDDGVSNRYLDFRFSRVYEGKDIARILVNVQDVSDAVLLEQRLEKERAQNDMQVEMLTTILNVSPALINDFINNTKAHIDKMNNILKNPGSSQFELEGKLKSLYREMHSLKGEASALKLHSFTKIATDAEDKLQALQNQNQLSGNDFLPLAVHLDDLLSLSQTIEALGERITASSGVNTIATKSSQDTANNITNNTTVQTTTNNLKEQEVNGVQAVSMDVDFDENHSIKKPSSAIESYYKNFADDIAKRQGKQIEMHIDGFDAIDGMDMSNDTQSAIKEIAVQLIRNAIVHGIETPEQRKSSFKAATGMLNMTLAEQDDMIVLSVEDDGHGIDYDKIRQKLFSLGRHSEDEIKELSKQQLLNTLFSSGFTTKESADEDGGRGVGLDIIKSHAKELGGKLNVHSEYGRLTRFNVKLPKYPV